MIDKRLGQRIKQRRQELNMTQTQLAEKTGYADKTAISKIEKGVVDLTQSKIQIFANALDISPAKLVTGFNEVKMTDSEWTELNELIGMLSPIQRRALAQRIAFSLRKDEGHERKIHNKRKK